MYRRTVCTLCSGFVLRKRVPFPLDLSFSGFISTNSSVWRHRGRPFPLACYRDARRCRRRRKQPRMPPPLPLLQPTLQPPLRPLRPPPLQLLLLLLLLLLRRLLLMLVLPALLLPLSWKRVRAFILRCFKSGYRQGKGEARQRLPRFRHPPLPLRIN